MAPGHQLHHLNLRAHLTFSQHQYLRVLTEYYCLWWVTYSDEGAQASLYHFPGPQVSLPPPPPPPPQAGQQPTGTPSTTELNSRIEALDLATREPRPSTSASVSTMTLTLGNTSDNQPQVKTLSSTLLTTNSLTYCLTSTKERTQTWVNSDVMWTSGYATRQQSRALGIYSLIPKEISGTVCSTGLHEVKSGKTEIWNWPKTLIVMQNASNSMIT